jgi:predicted nucleic acid-binding protein
VRLLDANVLLAMAWPNHPFHASSRAWFSRLGAQGWGTCQLVDAAFVRLSANAAVVPEPRRQGR